MSAMLNKKQHAAVEFVAKGHNLILLGKAGTGKSLTVGKIVQRCNAMGKICSVTATTGISCTLYPQSLNVMTIHRWSGVGDGRYGPAEIKTVVSNNVKYKDVLDRIYNTDILILDEFSMLSRRTLECLDAVCSLKNKSLFFGGIQVVLVGDLVQLPPVPCARFNEDGAYCFESHIYDKAFPHRLTLTECHRQTDLHLVKAIEEVSIGSVTTETIDMMKELSRPLSGSDDAIPVVKLFATNDLVDDYNRDKILECAGTLYEFTSTDTGDKTRNVSERHGCPRYLC